MDYPEIAKTGEYACKITPNLTIDALADCDFDWAQIENELGIENRVKLNVGLRKCQPPPQPQYSAGVDR